MRLKIFQAHLIAQNWLKLCQKGAEDALKFWISSAFSKFQRISYMISAHSAHFLHNFSAFSAFLTKKKCAETALISRPGLSWDNLHHTQYHFVLVTCASTDSDDERMFQCDDNSFCIPQAWQCDGTDDCDDKSDETNCTAWYPEPGSLLTFPRGQLSKSRAKRVKSVRANYHFRGFKSGKSDQRSFQSG